MILQQKPPMPLFRCFHSPCAIIVFGLLFALAVTRFGKKRNEVNLWKKKLQSISIAALIVSILPLATLIPSFLHLSLADGIRNCLGWGKHRFCPVGADSFSGLCAEQGKPQRYQYCIDSDQRFLAVADGRNCRTRLVPFFRSVRKQLCVDLGKFIWCGMIAFFLLTCTACSLHGISL